MSEVQEASKLNKYVAIAEDNVFVQWLSMVSTELGRIKARENGDELYDIEVPNGLSMYEETFTDWVKMGWVTREDINAIIERDEMVRIDYPEAYGVIRGYVVPHGEEGRIIPRSFEWTIRGENPSPTSMVEISPPEVMYVMAHNQMYEYQMDLSDGGNGEMYADILNIFKSTSGKTGFVDTPRSVTISQMEITSVEEAEKIFSDMAKQDACRIINHQGATGRTINSEDGTMKICDIDGDIGIIEPIIFGRPEDLAKAGFVTSRDGDVLVGGERVYDNEYIDGEYAYILPDSAGKAEYGGIILAGTLLLTIAGSAILIAEKMRKRRLANEARWERLQNLELGRYQTEDNIDRVNTDHYDGRVLKSLGEGNSSEQITVGHKRKRDRQNNGENGHIEVNVEPLRMEEFHQQLIDDLIKYREVGFPIQAIREKYAREVTASGHASADFVAVLKQEIGNAPWIINNVKSIALEEDQLEELAGNVADSIMKYLREEIPVREIHKKKMVAEYTNTLDNRIRQLKKNHKGRARLIDNSVRRDKVDIRDQFVRAGFGLAEISDLTTIEGLTEKEINEMQGKRFLQLVIAKKRAGED